MTIAIIASDRNFALGRDMKDKETLQFSPPMVTSMCLCVMAAFGMILVAIGIKNLLIHFVYNVPMSDGSNVVANVFLILPGTAIFLYFANFVFCRVEITEAEVAYQSLFAAKTIKRAEIISVHGAAESVEWVSAHYTVKAESKKITLNGLAFSLDQMRRMKHAVSFASPRL